ncbi:MAG: hypothetical protein WA814_01670 [Candidatus Baltobacteraceae bacterium]
MICTRCNQLSNETDRCSKCGTKLTTLESAQRRGWWAFGAGVFLVVFMGGVWIWVDRLLVASGALERDPGTAAFLGKMNVAFALVVLAGVLGTINGWMQAHSGRRNYVLILGLVVAFVAALFIAGSASNAYHPS